MMANRAFARTIGIDYSGENTPLTKLKGLAVYRADGNAPPQKVTPEEPASNLWTRREVAEWLVDRLREEGKPTLVGIDHAFSFPIYYFERYNLRQNNWDYFLDDFQEHWPMDGDNARVRDILNNPNPARIGDPNWRRVTDGYARGAKSVFRFIGQGQVGHSTHAGLPWLRYIRNELGASVHLWPFDGWKIPNGKSAIAEVYPALWSRRFSPADRNPHQQDAYSVAGWLSYADQNGCLPRYLSPSQSPTERDLARLEGWILGVLGLIY